MNRPLLIALCGVPSSGKSEVQKILEDGFGIMPVDDGDILRRYTAELLGIHYQDTVTQEGKRRELWVDGQCRDVRWALGEMGDILEAKYGPYVVPDWAIRKALAAWNDFEHTGSDVAGFSFGSVRKQQPWAYKRAGGLVVEVVRTGTDPTGYGFDLFDRKAVDFVFHNDGATLDELRGNMRSHFPYFIERAREAAQFAATRQEAA